MKGQMKENYFRPIFFAIVALVILFVCVLSLSFAVFVYSKKGTVTNTLITGTLMMSYTEGATGIHITNAQPMSDEAGKNLNGEGETFKFIVSAKVSGKKPIRYELAAIKKTGSTIADENVKLYLEKAENGTNYKEVLSPTVFNPIEDNTGLLSPKGSMILETGTFKTNQENHYILRMWLKESMKVADEPQSYTVTVNVYGSI